MQSPIPVASTGKARGGTLGTWQSKWFLYLLSFAFITKAICKHYGKENRTLWSHRPFVECSQAKNNEKFSLTDIFLRRVCRPEEKGSRRGGAEAKAASSPLQLAWQEPVSIHSPHAGTLCPARCPCHRRAGRGATCRYGSKHRQLALGEENSHHQLTTLPTLPASCLWEPSVLGALRGPFTSLSPLPHSGLSSHVLHLAASW